MKQPPLTESLVVTSRNTLHRFPRTSICHATHSLLWLCSSEGILPALVRGSIPLSSTRKLAGWRGFLSKSHRHRVTRSVTSVTMSDRSRPVSNILYRVYGADDQLLYVGATTNPSVRFQAHGWHTSWWNEASKITLEHCASLQALREAEAEAIRTESPRHNRIHARNRKPGPFRRRAFSSNEVAAGTTKVTASIHEQRNTHGTTYRVFWRDAGRQRTLSFPDLPDAQRFKDHLEQQGPAAALRAVSHG